MIACFFTTSRSCLAHLTYNLTDKQAEEFIGDTHDTSSLVHMTSFSDKMHFCQTL